MPPGREDQMRPFLIPLTAVVWMIFLAMNFAARGVLFRHKPTLEEMALTNSLPNANKPTETQLGDSIESLFTFVQISDLHISRFNTHGGLPHFQSFLEGELPLIGPDLVLLTGDLIDAKTKSKLGSVQYQDEWAAYQDMLNMSGMALRNDGKFLWEMRGNHDCFNLGVDFNETDFALKTSVKTQGYHYLHKKPFGTYDFLGIDLCPAVGTARPFNFFGTMDGGDMDALADAISKAKVEGRNHTFVATHYPTAVTISGKSRDGQTLSDLASSVSMWMSGHLHQLVLGLGRTMYAYHKHPGMLELELGDMKDHAVYRIVAIDHDMISFTDEIVSMPELPMPAPPNLGRIRKDGIKEVVQRRQVDETANAPQKPTRKNIPPVIIVTNPRDARFASPVREPENRMLTSTHIRMLIYSRAGVKPENITITIDGTRHGSSIKPAVGSEHYPAWPDSLPLNPSPDVLKNHLPLWVAAWEPKLYADGSDHILEIEVTDSLGDLTSKQIVFRVDNARSNKRMGLTASGTLILSVRFPLLVRLNYIPASFINRQNSFKLSLYLATALSLSFFYSSLDMS
ncbi:Transmembrane protein 62 [Phlyctochytrium planicorne]|nr:Transmembrane protein 62 [Phlyctochytrium planicorne]